MSFNLDSDGNGAGTVVVGGDATVDAEGANALADEQYLTKYGDYAASHGFSKEFLGSFTTRLKITIDKVWTARPAGVE